MRKAAKAKPAKASKSRLAAAATKPARRAGGGKAAAKATDSVTSAPAPAVDARIALSAECTLRDAPALQALLINTISPTDTVIIEAGAVQRIDAAALQLLVAFAQREQAAGRRLSWQEPAAELIESSARLGLTEVLGLDAPARQLA